MAIATFDSAHPNGNGSTPSSTTSTSSGSETSSNGSSNGGGGVPDLKIVNRVGNIPFVADGINTFEHVINSTALTANLYSIGQGVAVKSFNIASPLLARGQPLLEKADALANQGLDIAEDKFPYPFKTATKDIANDSVAVFHDRLGPYMNNEIIQRAIDQLYALNAALTKQVVGAKDAVFSVSHSAGQQAHAITGQIVDQLYQLQTHGKDLPPMIYDNLSKSFEDVKGIVGDKDKTSQQKVNELVGYIQSIVQPALKEAGDYLTKAQNKAEKKSGEVSEKAQDATAGAQKKAGEVKDGLKKKSGEAVDKAQDATAGAQKKAGEVTEGAKKKSGEAADKASNATADAQKKAGDVTEGAKKKAGEVSEKAQQ